MKTHTLSKTVAALLLCGAGAAVLLSCGEGAGRLGTASQALRPDLPGEPPPAFDSTERVETYASPGGTFAIHYTRVGRNAVPAADGDASGVPDYVEQTARVYDQVLAFYRDTLQFRAPPSDIGVTDGNGGDGRFDVYRVELRPWLWYLTLGADCRIFQDLNALEIIEKVFADYSGAQLEKKLTGSFRKRAYCVQYRESDFDFVSRLMEEEGIYYYFKQEKGRHTLVLCNSASGHTALTDPKLAWSAAIKDDTVRESVVTQWQRSQGETECDRRASSAMLEWRRRRKRSIELDGRTQQQHISLE